MIEPNFEPDVDFNLDFYIDAEGYFKVKTAPEYALLADYLESEIQGLAVICEDLMAKIADIESGDRAETQGVGNGYGLAIALGKATIWSEFTEPQVFLELPLDVFKRSLQTCLSFLKQNSGCE
jgi:hypothetical protein